METTHALRFAPSYVASMSFASAHQHPLAGSTIPHIPNDSQESLTDLRTHSVDLTVRRTH